MRTKTKLNILSLGQWDYAGVGYLLSKAINEHSEHSSRAARWATSYIEYPYDLLKPSPSVIKNLWKRADVVHIHDACGHLPRDMPAKPVVITWHGSMYRRASSTHNRIVVDKGWFPTVSTLDLTMLGNVKWMPNVRFEPKVIDRHSKFTVCHAPTSRPGKSTELVIDACKKVGVPLELIEKTKWQEALARKARCHLLVDQFTLGYGCNAIESWAIGMPVIANAKPQIIQKMKKIFNNKLPFYQCAESLDALCDAIVLLRDNGKLDRQYIDRGKEHFERYHSPQATVKRVIEFYYQAIDLFYSRIPGATVEYVEKSLSGLPGRDGMTMIRYIGGNIGQETYIGEVTGQSYKFSAGAPIAYVDSRDARHFLALGRTKRRQAKTPIFVKERA